MSPKTKTVLNIGMTKEEIVKTPEKKGSNAHASVVPESRKRAHDSLLDFTPDRPTKALRSPMAPQRIPAQTQAYLESSPSDSENILLSDLKNLNLNPKATAPLPKGLSVADSVKSPDSGDSVRAHRASPVRLDWPVGYGVRQAQQDHTPDHGKFRRMRATIFEDEDAQ
eukprot:s1468_g18.t1